MTDNEIALIIADYHLAHLETLRVALTALLREIEDAGGKPFEGLHLSLASHLQGIAQDVQLSADEGEQPLHPHENYLGMVVQNLQYLSEKVKKHFDTGSEV